MLLVQGSGVAGCAWRPQVDALSARHRCVTFDNRGVGGSGAIPGTLGVEDLVGDALAVLDVAGIDRAHVVGHSMGGLVAHRLALRAPARVRSLALLGTFACGARAAELSPWLVWVGLRANVGPRSMRRRAFLEMIASPAELASTDLESVMARYEDVLGRGLADAPAAAVRACVRAMSRDGEAGIGALRALASIPTLVVSAEHDRIAPVRHGEELARAIPGATFERWEGTAHGMTIERAAALGERLARHFASAP